jgi:hypothetical protein
LRDEFRCGRYMGTLCVQRSTHRCSRLKAERTAPAPDLGERWVVSDVDGMSHVNGEWAEKRVRNAPPLGRRRRVK